MSFKHRGDGKVTIELQEYERLVEAYEALENNENYFTYKVFNGSYRILRGDEVNQNLAESLKSKTEELNNLKSKQKHSLEYLKEISDLKTQLEEYVKLKELFQKHLNRNLFQRIFNK